ncbi:MAG: FecR domain-containing protein [Cytophagia bacterium]|nr:FecR domain-containing protein [Cytophagia bacterium]
MSSNSEDREDFLAKWLAGELTPEEKAEFESTDQGQDMLNILNSADKLAFPIYDVEAELLKLKQTQSRQETKVRSITPIWRMAVAAVLVVGVSLVYFLTKPNYEVYETQFGETQAITLPDNSVVTLNVSSALKFNPKTFTENRKLILEGEAFFEVTKGVNFEVNTEEGKVVVMGTSFNVKQRQKNLEIQVHTGIVKVTEGDIDIVLNKGDGVRIENGRLDRTWAKAVDEKPLWITENIVELSDVPFSEALESLRNSFGISIQSDISLTSKRFTGSYPGDNVEVAIQIVLSTEKLEYTYDPDSKQLSITGVAQN